MNKCEICGEKTYLILNNHAYCLKHYIENEEEECLYWHFDSLMISRDPESKKVLKEIKKKYPHFQKRYKEERKS